MFTLNIKVNGRISQICQGDGIVSGSVGIDSVKFITTSEWNTAAKKAVFYIDRNNVYESFLDDNNMAKVPYEVIQDIGILKIGLYGVYDDGMVITASIIEMELKEGYVRGITTAPGKYEDIYTQVLQQYSKIYEEMLCSAGSFSFSEDDNTTPDAVQEISPTVTSKIFTSGIIETNCDFLDIEKKSDSNTYLIFNKVSEDESREQFAFAFNTANDLKERIDVREVSKIEIVIKGKGPYDADPETYTFRKVKLIATALEDLTDKVSKEISEIALIKSDKIYIERSGYVIPDKPSSPSIKSYPTYDGMEYSVDIEEDGNILFYFGFTDNKGNSIKVIPIYRNSGTITDVDLKTATKVSVLSQRDLKVHITFSELLDTDSFNRYLNEKANTKELDGLIEKINKLESEGGDNHWKNKKWYAYGTSLTDIDNVGQYPKTVRDLSGLTLTNKGKSGGGICANTLIKDAVMNTTDGKTSADLITLEVGANDTSAILGTIYDTGDNTFCGALNQCIRYLQKNTNAQIVVISSTNSRYKSGDKTVEFTPEKTFASDNHTKYDQWKAIKEVCAINSVPYIAMGEEAGLGYARMIASDKYNIDNIHHTALAGKNLGEFVWSKLKDIPLWLSELNTTTLKITKQPTDVSVAIGDSAIFTVVAEGNNLSYQWQVSSSNGANWGDTALDGNKTPTLTVSPVGTVLNGRLYRCVVTDTLSGDTVTSNAAKLTVINTNPIKITTQPTGVDSAVGNAVSFIVETQGDGLTYQWQLSKDGGTTWENTSVNGNTTKLISFVIPDANYSGRMFRCVITDANGNTLASNPAKLTLNGVHDVTVTSQPKNLSAKVGDTVNIPVVAKSSKSNELTYQWQVSSTGETWKNTTVTGYNTSALNFVIPGANYNGRQYRCLVTDGNGSWALSDAMKLTVTS